MTTDVIPAPRGHSTSPESFTRLVQELVDLDYARVDNGDPQRADYTAIDSRLVVGLERGDTPHRAHLTTLDDHGDPAWMLTLTATTPEPAQLVALYTMLQADIGDETAIVRTVADSLNITLAADTQSVV